MLTARLTDDLQWIHVDGDALEMNQLKLSFTKKVNSWFIIKSKNPNAIVDEKFMNAFGLIPVGLWIDLINTCKRFGYQISFLDDFDKKIRNSSISYETFSKYIDQLYQNSPKHPRDYQMEGVYRMLEYKKACMEVSTSGGKTLMAYMLFRFMKDYLNYQHILIVTPKTDLTTQTAEKFVEYDSENQMITDWNYSEVHSRTKKKDTYDENIVFGNYQSLCKKKPEFFEKFDAVIVDECHHATSVSIRKIVKKCVNAEYKIGMTGTFPKEDSYDAFVLASYIGPVVFRLSSKELIDEKKSATPVYVNSFILKYLDDNTLNDLYKMRAVNKKDDPTLGSKILNYEKDIARNNPLRFKYICDMIAKTTKNSLVIFSDIENGYGRKIYNRLKDFCDNKNVYYIDGSITSEHRELMKKEMENDVTGNTIIVASMGCFSEGIDIANLFNIFLVETTKSETTLAQILGRGMRIFQGKEKTIMIDFVDDFRYYGSGTTSGGGIYTNNYIFKHFEFRKDIYIQKGFPFSSFEIDLRKQALF